MFALSLRVLDKDTKNKIKKKIKTKLGDEADEADAVEVEVNIAEAVRGEARRKSGAELGLVVDCGL